MGDALFLEATIFTPKFKPTFVKICGFVLPDEGLF